jgi:outer membrane protein, heavy metal efflux system
MKSLRHGAISLLLPPLLILASFATATAEETLTLDQAMARTMAANPELSAADLAVRANQQWALQAGRRPNPELGLEWENLAGSGDLSGVGASEMTVAASQLFELGGKRSLRTELADQETSRADWDRQSLALDLAQAVRERFLEVWLAQEDLALAAKQKAVDAKLRREIELRHEAGAASPIDLSRARVVVAAGEITRRQADQQLAAARRRLAALWGSRVPNFQDVVGQYEEIPEPDTGPAPEDGAGRNPDLARWQTEAALKAAERSLARALGKPDLTLGLGLRREHATGDVAFVVEAGLPIPFFDRNRSAVQAAGIGLDRMQRLAEAADNAIGSELDIARGQRLAAYQEIEILRRDILPLASESYSATESGHRRGLFSLTDVLETRRSLLEIRHTLLATLARYHLADIRISRLVGDPIENALEVEE